MIAVHSLSPFLSLCVSVPHFGDFHDTSEVFFVVIFVTVLFNQ